MISDTRIRIQSIQIFTLYSQQKRVIAKNMVYTRIRPLHMRIHCIRFVFIAFRGDRKKTKNFIILLSYYGSLVSYQNHTYVHGLKSVNFFFFAF